MRKLILITVIAIMSSSPCYANLTLASADPSQAATEQPKPMASEARPAAIAKSRSKSPSNTRPRRHVSRGAFSIRSFSAPVRGFYHHCL
jgi:hypothetical protein